MSSIARFILIVLMIKGLFLFVLPSKVRDFTVYFNGCEKNVRRIIGLFSVFIGIILIYLSGVQLSSPAIMWVLTLSGIYTILYGAAIIIIPGPWGRLFVWLTEEQIPLRMFGALLAAAGTALYLTI